MDISNITSLISTFRAETQEESITPESLGALLQKIADLLGTAALQTDVASIATWRTSLANIGFVLTQLTVGANDRNNVYLTLGKTNLDTGIAQTNTNAIVIRQATTERAGAMRAQQVEDLNKCKSDITSLTSSVTSCLRTINTIQSSLTTLSNRITTNTQSISANATIILGLQSDIKSLAKQMKQLDTDVQKFATMKQATQMHIECIVTEGTIVIQDAYRYVRQGLTPVIFRHSVRTSRRAENDNGIREYLPKRSGWNRFFDDGKLKVDSSGAISFRIDNQGDDNFGKYTTAADALFSNVRIIRDESTQKIEKVMVGFGKRSYDVLGKFHRFRFAIGFYKKSSNNPTFQFSELRTNLATFRVEIIAMNRKDGGFVIDYRFSM